MIRPANAIIIDAEMANLLTTVRADVILARAAFAGRPFHIEDEKLRPGQARTLFSEALVLRMIEAGLLRGGQVAAAWPERGVPARPFSVRLTEDGVQERIRLIRGLSTPEAA